jgi:hypothetical protein
LSVLAACCAAASVAVMRASRASASAAVATAAVLRRFDEVDISQQRTHALNTHLLEGELQEVIALGEMVATTFY